MTYMPYPLELRAATSSLKDSDSRQSYEPRTQTFNCRIRGLPLAVAGTSIILTLAACAPIEPKQQRLPAYKQTPWFVDACKKVGWNLNDCEPGFELEDRLRIAETKEREAAEQKSRQTPERKDQGIRDSLQKAQQVDAKQPIVQLSDGFPFAAGKAGLEFKRKLVSERTKVLERYRQVLCGLKYEEWVQQTETGQMQSLAARNPNEYESRKRASRFLNGAVGTQSPSAYEPRPGVGDSGASALKKHIETDLCSKSAVYGGLASYLDQGPYEPVPKAHKFPPPVDYTVCFVEPAQLALITAPPIAELDALASRYTLPCSQFLTDVFYRTTLATLLEEQRSQAAEVQRRELEAQQAAARAEEQKRAQQEASRQALQKEKAIQERIDGANNTIRDLSIGGVSLGLPLVGFRAPTWKCEAADAQGVVTCASGTKDASPGANSLGNVAVTEKNAMFVDGKLVQFTFFFRRTDPCRSSAPGAGDGGDCVDSVRRYAIGKFGEPEFIGDRGVAWLSKLAKLEVGMDARQNALMVLWDIGGRSEASRRLAARASEREAQRIAQAKRRWPQEPWYWYYQAINVAAPQCEMIRRQLENVALSNWPMNVKVKQAEKLFDQAERVGCTS